MRPMRLKDLVRRKLIDYDINVYELSVQMAGYTDFLNRITSGRITNPSLNARKELCARLDIAPEVLDAAIRESLKEV